MRKNRDSVVPINILTPFARAPFSWAARHTTVCLDTPNSTLTFYFDITNEISISIFFVKDP